MTPEELKEVLDLHAAYLQGKPEGKRANLYRANLSGADLYRANLSGANLSGANLRGAYLSRADLSGVDLRWTNLIEANLREANLNGANLRGANLRGANLREASIANAVLPTAFKIARIDFGGWSVLVTPTYTSIGCQTHASKDWLKWKPKDVKKFAEGASEWWKQYGAVVKAAIKSVQKP
jgi:hypothetical protein